MATLTHAYHPAMATPTHAYHLTSPLHPKTCCSMLAIAVAVRVDVYGVFYAVVLGTLTAAQGVATAARHLSPVVPGPLHKFLLALLISYLVLHGAVLGFQYALLLGLPLGVCLSPGIDNGVCVWLESVKIIILILFPQLRADYPWGNMTVPLKKWLFLPEPNQQILDKKLLLGRNQAVGLMCVCIYVVCDVTFLHVILASCKKKCFTCLNPKT